MPVAWDNLTAAEVEHAKRQGWATGAGMISEMIYGSGQMAAYYAWGRLDQGHPEVVPCIDAQGFHRSRSDNVLAFKILFERAYRDMYAGVSVSAPSVQSAWEKFVDSAGTSVTPGR